MTPGGAIARFRPPRGTALLTGEGPCRVEMKEVDHFMGNFVRRFTNAFHRMRIDTWLAHYFCLLAVTATDLGMTGRTLEKSDTSA